ncbi:hypothetical protein JQ615_07205 [Bradyrhizobium jicamae]|uniref:Uncharacterized protein n=1 Tax=Bradyrhizobium jicamae TaxID=280332 RepID=A0ABS5FED5_9BRAD|nr:hypothetical protein [Bradyrhizobium jicamae]MBR0795169.1 hypothetical protein [Bradyrhizobium jicamae]
MSMLQNCNIERRQQPTSGSFKAVQCRIGLIRRLGRSRSHRAEIGDYRRLERICRQLAEESTMPELRTAMLIMADRYLAAASALERGNRAAITETF